MGGHDVLLRYLHENPHREDSLLLANGPQEQKLLELREAPVVSSPLPGGFFQVRRFGVEELRLDLATRYIRFVFVRWFTFSCEHGEEFCTPVF